MRPRPQSVTEGVKPVLLVATKRPPNLPGSAGCRHQVPPQSGYGSAVYRGTSGMVGWLTICSSTQGHRGDQRQREEDSAIVGIPRGPVDAARSGGESAITLSSVSS